MSELRDPVRLRELSGELPADVIAGLRAYERTGPSATERARMRDALVARVQAEPAAPSSARATSGKLTKLRKRLGVVTGLCTVAVVLGARMLAVPDAPSASAISRPSEVVVAPPPAPTSTEPTVSPQPPAAIPQPAAATASRPPAPRRKQASARAVASDPAAELTLLKRARRALASAPTDALALTNEHLRAHPRGVFEQERELIAVEALVRGGKSADAARRAAAFRAHFPRSAHLERLRVVLEEPAP